MGLCVSLEFNRLDRFVAVSECDYGLQWTLLQCLTKDYYCHVKVLVNLMLTKSSI